MQGDRILHKYSCWWRMKRRKVSFARSEALHSETQGRFEWTLVCTLSTSDVVFHLYLQPPRNSIQMLRKLKLTNSDDKEIFTYREKLLFDGSRLSSEFVTVPIRKFDLQDMVDVTCKVITLETRIYQTLPYPFGLLKNISQFYLSSKNSDLTLKVGEANHPAHIFVLAANSPVFSAMFQHETLEKQRGLVEISDMSVETLKSMLRFMYFGKVEEPLGEKDLLDLLIAADKYDIQELKSVCETRLMWLTTTQNVLRNISFGKIYSERLRKYGLLFLCYFQDEFFQTNPWDSLKETSHEVLVDILKIMAE